MAFAFHLRGVQPTRTNLRVVTVGKNRRPRGVPESSPLHRIQHVADKYEAKLERTIAAVFAQVRDDVDLKALAEALEAKNLSAAYAVLRIEQRTGELLRGVGVDPRKDTAAELLRTSFTEGAQSEVLSLRDVPVQKAKKDTVGFQLEFNASLPQAERIIETQLMSLIRETSQETQRAIADVVLDAFRQGGHPFDQARKIRTLVGLTRRQAQAVRNFRDMLESGDPARMSEALSRALRDRRFDSTINRAIERQLRLPQNRIDTMVNRYTQRYLNYRAKMIARTETKRAAIAGQQEAWRQAQQQGLLDPNKTRRIWILAPFPCPVCSDIASMNADGVPLDKPFVTPDGGLMNPPQHPNCRCDVGLMFEDSRVPAKDFRDPQFPNRRPGFVPPVRRGSRKGEPSRRRVGSAGSAARTVSRPSSSTVRTTSPTVRAPSQRSVSSTAVGVTPVSPAQYATGGAVSGEGASSEFVSGIRIMPAAQNGAEYQAAVKAGLEDIPAHMRLPGKPNVFITDLAPDGDPKTYGEFDLDSKNIWVYTTRNNSARATRNTVVHEYGHLVDLQYPKLENAASTRAFSDTKEFREVYEKEYRKLNRQQKERFGYFASKREEVFAVSYHYHATRLKGFWYDHENWASAFPETLNLVGKLFVK